MAKTGTLTLRVDQDVRRRSEQILGQLGVSLSGAVDMFLNQIVLTGGIPFPVRLPGHAQPVTSGWDIADAVTEEAARFEAIRRVILFGSFARGDETADSDIDLCLELDDEKKFSAIDLSRFADRIENACGREVDVLTSRSIRNRELRESIEREGRVLYERA